VGFSNYLKCLGQCVLRVFMFQMRGLGTSERYLKEKREVLFLRILEWECVLLSVRFGMPNRFSSVQFSSA